MLEVDPATVSIAVGLLERYALGLGRAKQLAVPSASERAVTLDRARLERQIREAAPEHAAARLDDAEYLTRTARLRGELEITGAETWRRPDPAEDRPDVIHAARERIVIEGPSRSHPATVGTRPSRTAGVGERDRVHF